MVSGRTGFVGVLVSLLEFGQMKIVEFVNPVDVNELVTTNIVVDNRNNLGILRLLLLLLFLLLLLL